MTDIHLWQYLAEFFLERNCFRTKVAGKLKTHILFSITFFFFFLPKIVPLVILKNTVEPDRPQMAIQCNALFVLNN